MQTRDIADVMQKQFPRIYKSLMPYEMWPKALFSGFPRVLGDIEQKWGEPECYRLINELLMSDRAGRAGFPLAVLDELILLKNVFEVTFEKLASNPHDPFSKARAQDLAALVKQLGEEAKRRKDAVAQQEDEALDAAADPLIEAVSDEIHSLEALQERLTEMEYGRTFDVGPHRKIGEILYDSHHVKMEALDRALQYQAKAPTHHLVGEILVTDGEVSPVNVIRACCLQRGIPVVDPTRIELSTEALRLVPLSIARNKGAMPIAIHDRRMIVAVPNPFDSELQEYFSFVSGYRVTLVFAKPDRILSAYATYDGASGASKAKKQRGPKSVADSSRVALLRADEGALQDAVEREEVEEEISLPQDAVSQVDENDETVIGLVNKVVNDAVRLGASDIHFEAFPRSKNAQIRLRRDGAMERHSDYPVAYHAAVVSRIKIMADMDISERRKAQDGKIAFGVGNKRLDLRVSTIPTSNSLESVTIRVLAAGKPMALSKIGMSPLAFQRFREQIMKPYGLILVCGPTGSGKTTTLHSVLRELNTPDRKIWTAEDPIEIVQKNVNQVQVLPKIGWTFAQALRAFLRADPDVIMIGEIRDAETGKVAVESSMTGHLVLSTLHTNSAAETLARLVDLGVAPFNLADAALAIMAQRLARRVCSDCGAAYEFNEDELDTLVTEYMASVTTKSVSKAERDRILSSWRQEFGRNGVLMGKRAVGCELCHGSGYRGRLGLYELLEVSMDIKRLIRNEASTGDIVRQAVAEGMKTLRQDGIEKVLQGLTDFKEVRTVCL